MTRRARALSWLWVGLVTLFLFSPVVLVVLFSLNSGNSSSPPFEGVSLRWYEQVFDDPVLANALKNTAIAAVATCALVLVMGTAAAFALSRRRSQVLDAISILVVAPLMLPGLVIGVGLLAYFSRLHVQMSLLTVIVGHALVTLPFVVLIVNARLLRLDRAIVEAARDLGASTITAFRRVVLPLIFPALVGAGLLALAWSADELIITLFTNGGDTTVPVQILAMTRRGLDPSINAIASVIMLTTIVATLVASRFISVRDISQ